MHTFLPFLRMGGRGQLGVVLAGGLSANASGTAEVRVTGPIFVNDPSDGFIDPVVTVPVGPGFMVDDQFRTVEVAPGETEAVDTVDASVLYFCTSSNQSGPLRLRRKRDFLPLCRVVRRPLILSPSCS